MLKTLKVYYVLFNSNYLIEIYLCKNLFSLERFCKPCYGLFKDADAAFYKNTRFFIRKPYFCLSLSFLNKMLEFKPRFS